MFSTFQSFTKLRWSGDPIYSVFGSSNRRVATARATEVALERTALLYGPRPRETIPRLMIIWPLPRGNNTVVYTWPFPRRNNTVVYTWPLPEGNNTVVTRHVTRLIVDCLEFRSVCQPQCLSRRFPFCSGQSHRPLVISGLLAGYNVKPLREGLSRDRSLASHVENYEVFI
ncbi:hypothetical protein CsSME_00040084 [Camellia sinensis var. sinensis]